MIILNEQNNNSGEKSSEDNMQQLSLDIDNQEDFFQEELDFETALDKLEEIVNELEGDMLSLEESVEKFTLGMKLIKYCQQELNRAEGKIEQVMEEHGELKEIIPFEWPRKEE